MATDITIINRDVYLTAIRELLPAGDLIHRRIAPFEDVPDTEALVDVMLTAGVQIAPYRSPDAEAKLGSAGHFDQKLVGVCDIARKRRFNHGELLAARDVGELPGGYAGTLLAQAKSKALKKINDATVANRVDIDARLEKQAIDAFQGGVVATKEDGLIFDVDYGIPAAQKGWNPTTSTGGGGYYWDDEVAGHTAKVLSDILRIKKIVRDARGMRIQHMLCSESIMLAASKNATFQSTMANVGKFVTGPDTAREIIAAETSLDIQIYDAMYATRAMDVVAGGSTATMNRYLPERRAIFWADPPDGTPLMQTLTAPHALANWQTGFYSWQVEVLDPYKIELGAGIQAFPFLRYPGLVVTADLLAP